MTRAWPSELWLEVGDVQDAAWALALAAGPHFLGSEAIEWRP